MNDEMRLDVFRDGDFEWMVVTADGELDDMAFIEAMLALSMVPIDGGMGVRPPPPLERVEEDGPGVYVVKSRGRVVGMWRKA